MRIIFQKSAYFFSLRSALVCAILWGCSKSGVAPAPVIPVITIQDVTLPRGTSDGTMRFTVSSSKKISTDVSFDYSLLDGTAVASMDYVSSSGTVTIPANANSANIDIQIKGDPTNLRQPNLQFSMVLSNPKSCSLAKTSATGTLVTENGTYLPTDNTGYSTPDNYPNYTLVWSNEYSSGTSVDFSEWNAETGNGSGGWGNNELEYYTSSTKNLFVSNGNLIIEARKESIGGFNYSSARINTGGKKVFKYGRIDIRAKLPVSKGMWPALWMLGTNIGSVGWPACGEIDIMELVGSNPNRVTGTMHWKGTGGGDALKNANYTLSNANFSQAFHVFSIEWKQDTISWYVDDQLYLTNTSADVGNATYPFNADQFFIFNVAVGGNWPGPPDDTTIFPQRMFVDYVRVFQ